MCKENKEKTIEEKIFGTLDNWRQLPEYQLERRVDIYFAIYLKKILNRCLKEKIELVIPEFPIWENKDNYRPWYIDYMCLSNEKVYFVELKTDIKSIDDDQLKRMKNLDKNFSYYMEDLKELTTQSEKSKQGKKTRSRLGWRKYVHIFELFSDVYEEKIKQIIKGNTKHTSRAKVNKYIINELDFDKLNFEIKCIYIVPIKSPNVADANIKQITFGKIVSEFDDKFKEKDYIKDSFLEEFIKSLRKWKNPVFHEEEIQS